MPPRARYKREEIVQVAFQMTRENGIESVAARELGKRLGTSSSPIFTAFKNMEELQAEVRKVALKEFEQTVRGAMEHTPAFKWVGLKMIQFAIQEPKLFQCIYMKEQKEVWTYDDMVEQLGKTVDVCLDVIEKDYGLQRKDAEFLFKQSWLHTFGICVLLAGKICTFTEEEISEMLSADFQGALMLLKSGQFKVIEPDQ